MSEPARINPENLERWAYNAESHWMDMVLDDNKAFGQLHQNYKHCLNKYGQCPAYAACHTLLRDESKMETIYVRKEKR